MNRDALVSWGLFGVRLVMGWAFVQHGWGKIQHPFDWMGDKMPAFLQFLAAFSEFGGGLALIVGLLVRLASAGLLCTMFVATFMVHMASGHSFVSSKPGEPSYELAAIYLALSFMFLLAGPGNISLDHMLSKMKKK